MQPLSDNQSAIAQEILRQALQQDFVNLLQHSQPSNMYHGAEEEVDTSSHSSRSDELQHQHVAADQAATTTTTTHKPPATASSGKAAEQNDEKEDTTKVI